MHNNQSVNLQHTKMVTKSYLHARPKHYDFSYKNPCPSKKTIDELLNEGYVGVDRQLAKDNAFAAVAYKFKNQIKWTISNELEERVWLMTTDKQALKKLSDFMLNKFSWCPMIYSTKPEETFIFSPKNDTEKAAIEATISGEYGWQGSLYSLELYEYQENEAGFIFTTKPLNSLQQEWLLVKLNFQDYTGSWSHHDGTLEQVYYIWKENIQLSEPNYHPTSDEILDAIND
ncbi:hypothetical protein I4641_13155 [Waterburya agarophytonicola K14]|uniref:Uncharacterized protein n=1 Tax=Waterburya agarophytonicola KI4 TaxID=2874699 RepID=A0A964FG85_9CYAN|nr:hypothetical protein [Waterburya agarophytonicola]MCC0177927.1 hypothetical protein [Waterburya agarophytonicola KI4]